MSPLKATGLVLAAVLAAGAVTEAVAAVGDEPATPPHCQVRTDDADPGTPESPPDSAARSTRSPNATPLKASPASPPGMHPRWHRFLPGMFR